MSDESPEISPDDDVTRLINLAASGDEAAARQVMPAVYEQLRQLADRRRRNVRPGETLRTTAIVHEAYVRILDRRSEDWQNRSHFYFAAARAMRDILVEDARRRDRLRHGGHLVRVTLDDAGLAMEIRADHVMAIDRCLEELKGRDEVGHKIVMLRFFVGMTMTEIAELLETPLRSVERKWRFLRTWLATELPAS